jgi:hypothetical protein
VILTGCDGDQPGVEMNLLRFVEHRPDAPGLRQHQGPAGPLPQPDDAGRLRRQWGQTPHGHQLRRRHQDLLRAGDRGQRHRHAGGQARHDRDRAQGSCRRPRLDVRSRQLRSSAASSTMSWAPSRRPASTSSPRPTTRRRRTTSTSASSARAPLYSFYVPYHLTVFEVPLSVARAVLLGELVDQLRVEQAERLPVGG